MQQLHELSQKITLLIEAYRALAQEKASLKAQLERVSATHKDDQAWEDEKAAIRSSIDELLVHIDAANTMHQGR